MNWKRWMLGCALFGAVACADSENDGSSPDGSAVNPNGGGVDGGGAGSDAGGRLDAGAGNGNGSGNGDGGGTGTGGGNPDGGGCDQLKARVRDFKKTHPDFETFKGAGATRGLVAVNLGSDSKPVYTGICDGAGSEGSCPYELQTTSKANFEQWYTDVLGVNQAFEVPLPLSNVGEDSFEFNSSAFFPIDNKGFQNEGNPHNYHFTTEVHTSFTYRGGEEFAFNGDDDLWIFVNGKLALDLGGLHTKLDDPATTTIFFDAQAAQLGIVKGQTYRMDIFHAERHTTESNFRIRTNIECFINVDLI